MNANLWFVHITCDMGFVFSFRNISPPARHKFYVLKISFLPFELEVSINRDIEGIQESVNSIRKFNEFNRVRGGLTIMGQPFPRVRARRTFHHQLSIRRGVNTSWI